MNRHTFIQGRHLLIAVLIVIMTAFFTVPVSAGTSIGISCDSQVEKGDTFIVTVTFKGDNIGRVQGQMTYDNSVLSYVSGGSSQGDNGYIELSDGGTGENIVFKLKFKAAGGGSSNLAVSTQGVYNLEEEYVDAPSASAKVTVNDAEPEIQETSAVPTEESSDVTYETEDEDSSGHMIAIAVCAAVILLIVAAVIVYRKKRYRGRH